MIERQIEAMRRARRRPPPSGAGGRSIGAGTAGRAAPRARRSRRRCIRRSIPEIQRLKGEIAAGRSAGQGRERAAGRGARAGTQRRPDLSAAARASATPRKLRIREHERAGGADISSKSAMYQGRVEAAPMIEQQLELAEPRVRAREAAAQQPRRTASGRAAGRGSRTPPRRRAVHGALPRLPPSPPGSPDVLRLMLLALLAASWSPAHAGVRPRVPRSLGLRRARAAKPSSICRCSPRFPGSRALSSRGGDER